MTAAIVQMIYRVRLGHSDEGDPRVVVLKRHGTLGPAAWTGGPLNLVHTETPTLGRKPFCQGRAGAMLAA
jgi:hypothetical protein